MSSMSSKDDVTRIRITLSASVPVQVQFLQLMYHIGMSSTSGESSTMSTYLIVYLIPHVD